MSVNEVQAGDPAGLRRLRARFYTESTLWVRKPWTQVTPASKQIKGFPVFGLSASELRRNHKTWSAGVLGIARSSEEDGGFGSRGGRTGITNVCGEELGVDTRRVSGRVVVNLRRSNIWRHEAVICVGVGGDSGRRRRRVGKREGARRHASDEELDEDTSEEGNEDVNHGEPLLLGRVLDLLRGKQGFVLVPIDSVVILGISRRLDVFGISGTHTSNFEAENKRCCRSITCGSTLFSSLPSWPSRTLQPGFLVGVREVCVWCRMLISCVVPVGIAAALFQASIYDVPGGYRAVMFDRFSGVKDKVNPRGAFPQPNSRKLSLAGYAGGHTFLGAVASTCHPI